MLASILQIQARWAAKQSKHLSLKAVGHMAVYKQPLLMVCLLVCAWLGFVCPDDYLFGNILAISR